MGFDEEKLNEAVERVNDNVLKEVVDKAKRLNQNKEFVYHLSAAEDEEKIHNTDIKEAREDGLSQGKSERNTEIALNMLSKGYDINSISEVTGLSIEEVENLKENK